MGDATLMTIEFLRARLLSERSVSRTAKQRADQLGKRVMELEEKLRIMVIQRKKAEKAAAEVVDILENQGICDFYGVIDSSSEQDGANGGREGSGVKEDETSTASRKSEIADGLPGSEIEASPSEGRSLSWKGRDCSQYSNEKQKIKQIMQKHSSFSSTVESSGIHHLGKSCRKISRRETRSAAEDESDKHILYPHGKRGATQSNHSDGQLDFRTEASRNDVEEVSPQTSVACSLDDHIKEIDAGLYVDRRDRDEEMERVLEHQAKLIDQYQAEENAQREWEEKYNETKISTLSEVISNTEEPTAQIPSDVSVPTIQAPHTTDPKKTGSNKEVIVVGLSNGFIHIDPPKTGSSSQTCSDGALGLHTRIQDTEASSQEFAFPAPEQPNMKTNSKQDQGMLHGNIDDGSHRNSSSHPHGNGFIKSPPRGNPSSVNSASKFSRWRSPQMQNQLQRLLPQSPSSRLGGVLQALQHAKTSLGQLGGIPLSNQGTLVRVVPTDPHVRTLKCYGGDLEVPVGPTGPSRLPTDSFTHSSFSVSKFYGPGSSLTSNGYQYHPTIGYAETGPRVSAGKQYFDPSITPAGTGLHASSRYSLRYSHETNPNRGGFSKSGMDVRNEMPAGDRYRGGNGSV